MFYLCTCVLLYTHEQAVDDGVNVGAFGTFCIETEITKRGGKVEPTMEQLIEIRDKRTRKQRWETQGDGLRKIFNFQKNSYFPMPEFDFSDGKNDYFKEVAGGGAQPNISKDIVVKTDIPLPPLSVQQQIVDKIEKIFTEIETIEKLIRN